MSRDRAPSAAVQAEILGFEIADREQQIAAMQADLVRLQRQQRNWAKGARGEQDVVRALSALAGDGFRVLADRRWPGRRRANLDVLVVGPGGVAVVDVKAWADARVVDGRLLNGSHDAADDVAKVADQAVAVERELAEIGMPPGDVVPMLVLAGRRGIRARFGRVVVLGEGDLARALLAAGARLTPAQVECTARHLDNVCPPMPEQSLLDRVRGLPAQRPRERATGTTSRASVQDGEDDALLTLDDVHAVARQAAEAGPIEAWMAWLHPDQARLVARRATGASRIRGAAGTGKTVVALHRAKLLAAEGRSVLFTSYVRTVPAVARGVFDRLAPGLHDRVTFRSLHGVAYDVLRESGSRARADAAAAETCFARAWGALGRDSVLGALGVPYEYWRDEVVGLIGGRDVRDAGAYARLARTGRETRLGAAQREAVWALHERYSELKAERGVHDHADVLRLARDEARTRPASGRRFDAVIVDEVQDLTTVGLQLLVALAGDGPDNLLLVGDGQQSVYPAALSLAEAGVDVRGRSVVLRRNYRNGAAILEFALAVVAGDGFDDLEDGPDPAGGRDVETTRPGGEVVESRCADDATTAMALCSRIEELCLTRGVRHGDVAVLVPTNADAAAWLATLRRHGIPAIALSDYDGTTCDRVKVGTFHRSKGLEFAHVLVPDRDRYPMPPRAGESDDAFAERAARERRTLLVALSRARDGVWVSSRV